MSQIVLPDLRPTVAGEPVPGTEIADLDEVLTGAEQWIDSAEAPDPQLSEVSRWTAWPDDPDYLPSYGTISLNTGAAGIAWYAGLAADAGRSGAAERRDRALATVAARCQEDLEAEIRLPLAGLGVGFYGGLGGLASVTLGLADQSPVAADLAPRIVAEILDRQGRTGGREAGWTGVNALLGDAGPLLVLLQAADQVADLDPSNSPLADRARRAAVAVGELLLAEERRDGNRSSWIGVTAQHLGAPATDGPPASLGEGFEVGTTGIAYALAELGRRTGQSRFVDAAVRGATSIVEAAVPVGEDAVLQGGARGYAFGYCSGSAGAIRGLVGVFRATGDRAWLEWAERFGRGILRSGVPGRHTPGNLWVQHQCCGGAGILEAFLGLWWETGDQLWLDAARVQADDLVIRSTVDQRGRRWYSEAFVLPVGRLKAEVGHQVGASGVGVALLRMQAAEQGRPDQPSSTRRLADDPFS